MSVQPQNGSMGHGRLQVGDLSILLIQLRPHFLEASVLAPAMTVEGISQRSAGAAQPLVRGSVVAAAHHDSAGSLDLHGALSFLGVR